jgi:AraC-like DNA-binding protein
VSSGPSENGVCRFSTNDLPAGDRMEIWREVCGRQIMRLEMDFLSGAAFHADIKVRALPGLVAVSGTLRGIRQCRTRELLADSNDDLLLVMNRSGVGVASQLGRELTLHDGDAVLMTGADVGAFTYTAAGAETIALRLGRAALTDFVSSAEDLAMRQIPRDSEALKLLVRYVDVLDDRDALSTPSLQRAVTTHLYDLASLAIGASGDGAAYAAGRGLRAARLAAVKADIKENLGNSELSLTAVAARRRLTPRHVQRLFERGGLTFSEFVLGERLARAHRVLVDPRRRNHTISAIAFEVGFNDLSYFNRTFRRRYGVTPSDMRDGVRTSHSSDSCSVSAPQSVFTLGKRSNARS